MNNIPMNAPMALATQQGIKTQTRRLIKDAVEICSTDFENGLACIWVQGYQILKQKVIRTPYKIGQVLWVREPAKVIGTGGDNGMEGIEYMRCQYLSDGAVIEGVNIERFYSDDFSHLPSWITSHKGIPNGCIKEMARIFIRVTNIRVERLNEISEEDAEKEGIAFLRDIPDADETLTAKQLFYCLWEGINGNGSFDNRWVWVLEFELISKEEAQNGTL